MIEVIEVAPERSAAGGVSSMATLSERALTAAGLRVITVETVSGDGRLQSAFQSMGAVVGAVLTIRAHPNAVVHLHVSQGGSALRKGAIAWYAHRHGHRVVSHVHGSHFDKWASASAWRRWWIDRVLGHWSESVIALSGTWRDRLDAISPGANIKVVPNAVEPLEPSGSVASLVPLVVFAGRVGPRKGVPELQVAIKSLLDEGIAARFVIAGDGCIQSVHDWTVSEGLEHAVVVPGWLASDDLRDLLQRAAIFVLPSHDEGLPVVLLEAMSAGLGCISTYVGAIPEVIQNGENGLLVESGDAGALTDALRCMILSPDRRKTMGERARDTVMAHYTLSMYSEVLRDIMVRREGVV